MTTAMITKKPSLTSIKTTPMKTRNKEPSAMSVNALAQESRAERVPGEGEAALAAEPDLETTTVEMMAHARVRRVRIIPVSALSRSSAVPSSRVAKTRPPPLPRRQI